MHFEENSRLVMSGSGIITAADAANIGAACTFAFDRGSIFVCRSSEKGSEGLANAFIAGALSAGSSVIDGGVCIPPAGIYASQLMGCAAACFIHTEITASFSFTDSHGMELFRSCEDRLIAAIGKVQTLPYSHFGQLSVFGDGDDLYAAKMSGIIKGKLDGIFADVYSSSRNAVNVLNRILEGKNDRNGTRIAVHISGDCRLVSFYTEDTGYVTREKLMLICCRDSMLSGEDIAVCGMPSKALERMAAQLGRRIVSCNKNICSEDGEGNDICVEARRLAYKQEFSRSAAVLAAEVLEIMRRRKVSLVELIAELPPQVILSRFIPADKPSELLQRLCVGAAHSDGILSDGEAGRVTIRPVRTGKGMILSVESYSLETAEELCGFYSDIAVSSRRKL